MRTPHVLDRLPLWIEGDLGQPERAAIDGHLAECPVCREAAEELRRSQAWLREAMTPPFEAPDRDRLRRAVMDRIREEATLPPSPRFRTRPILLAACAASLLVASLAGWWLQDRGHPTAMVVVPPTPKAAPNPARAAMQPTTIEPRVAHPPRGHIVPVPRHETGSPPPEPARIEFQTADPNIRIIWLAQAKPLPETDPSLPEAL